MKILTKLAIAAAAAGGLSLAASAASADVVCNSENVCWHVHRHHYNYDPSWNVVVHPDNWRWGPSDHYSWREHEGRGYWRNGVWVRF
jgi:hypothetical protein